jgi:hypothetical protein
MRRQQLRDERARAEAQRRNPGVVVLPPSAASAIYGPGGSGVAHAGPTAVGGRAATMILADPPNLTMRNVAPSPPPQQQLPQPQPQPTTTTAAGDSGTPGRTGRPNTNVYSGAIPMMGRFHVPPSKEGARASGSAWGSAAPPSEIMASLAEGGRTTALPDGLPPRATETFAATWSNEAETGRRSSNPQRRGGAGGRGGRNSAAQTSAAAALVTLASTVEEGGAPSATPVVQRRPAATDPADAGPSKRRRVRSGVATAALAGTAAASRAEVEPDPTTPVKAVSRRRPASAVSSIDGDGSPSKRAAFASVEGAGPSHADAGRLGGY